MKTLLLSDMRLTDYGRVIDMVAYKVCGAVVKTVYDKDNAGNPVTYGECGIEGCPCEVDGKCTSKKCIQTDEKE